MRQHHWTDYQTCKDCGNGATVTVWVIDGRAMWQCPECETQQLAACCSAS